MEYKYRKLIEQTKAMFLLIEAKGELVLVYQLYNDKVLNWVLMRNDIVTSVIYPTRVSDTINGKSIGQCFTHTYIYFFYKVWLTPK